MSIVVTKILKVKKQPKKSTLIRKADDLWRKIVKQKGYCEWCGKSGGVQNAHHIMGRSRHSLRWDIRNGVCLCYKCHTDGAHSPNAAKVEEYLKWIKSYRPDDWRYLKDKLKRPPETVNFIKLMEYLNIMEVENE